MNPTSDENIELRMRCAECAARRVQGYGGSVDMKAIADQIYAWVTQPWTDADAAEAKVQAEAKAAREAKRAGEKAA